MKTIAWIAVFIGVVNLLCGKFLPGLSFAIVGGLMLLFYASRDSHSTISNNKNLDTNNANGQGSLLSFAMDVKTTEKVIGADFESWEQRDIIETVESFKRWALNQGCHISEVKEEFLKKFKEVFENDDIEDVLFHLKTKEKEEATRFNIKESNTCTHYMVRWIRAAQVIEQTKQKAKEKSPQGDKTLTKMKVRNKKTAKELVISENAPLQFINHPTCKMFFECGKIRGYVSPAVKAKINTVELDDLQYAECALPGTDNWVPCLMFRSSSYLANGIRTIGAETINDTKHSEVLNLESSDEDLPF